MVSIREAAKSEDTQTELATTRSRERDETQKLIDGMVGDLIGAWEAAGKPGEGVPNTRLETDDKTELKRRIARAFTLHSANRTPKLRPLYFKDTAPDAEGFVRVKWGVGIVPETAKDGQGEAQSATQAPDASAAGDTPEAQAGSSRRASEPRR